MAKPLQRNIEYYENVPLSALLYATRGTYTNAIQRAQAKIGCEDVPASGESILSAMQWSDSSFESIVHNLGITKQAVSQTVETLVSRGYLERTEDPSDRRKVDLSLTDRGRAAGRAARIAIERVDRDLRARVGPDSIAHARKTLLALLEIKRESLDQGAQDKEA
jgi:DNA-binding MarR family transcriptional regulator